MRQLAPGEYEPIASDIYLEGLAVDPGRDIFAGSDRRYFCINTLPADGGDMLQEGGVITRADLSSTAAVRRCPAGRSSRPGSRSTEGNHDK